ncbi:MAG TPA: hypothetical protein V6C88_19265 [Chroococcidiopsis sp.]
MYIIDLALKNTPSMLSVQRKTEEDAQTIYKQVVEAIRTGNPTLIELTCEQQVDKKLTVLVSELAAVQLSEKSGTGTASGRVPGFFAMTEP